MKWLFQRLFLLFVFCGTWILVKLWRTTCRVEHHGPLLEALESGRPVLLTWWHQDMIFNFAFLVRYARRRKVLTIVSRSWDGEVAAYTINGLGIETARGSSSRGGSEALSGFLSRVIEENAVGIIVSDGPRPPARVAKIGIVAAARRTGLPILMVRSWADRQHLFRKSWPKLTLVRPFSNVVLLSDGPITVPPDTSREGLEKYRKQVEEGLNRLAERSEHYFV
jgi:lysophospholipid acyltransferase (LPLAT)-like uncharacterized protein